MSAELTWVLMSLWFIVVSQAIISKLTSAWLVARMTHVSSAIKRLVKYSSEQAHSAMKSLIGTDRECTRLGVSGRQKPEERRRDPRAVPGGNLTDPYVSTTQISG